MNVRGILMRILKATAQYTRAARLMTAKDAGKRAVMTGGFETMKKKLSVGSWEGKKRKNKQIGERVASACLFYPSLVARRVGLGPMPATH